MDLVLAVVEVWKSDANALVREKLRRLSATRLEPILSAVVRQGIAEGTIHATGPDETARVLVYLLQGYQEHVSEQFLGRRSGAVSFEEVRRGYAAFQEAFERILGVPAGSVELLDDATLRFWFGEQPREATA
jgi:hypothetical protein